MTTRVPLLERLRSAKGALPFEEAELQTLDALLSSAAATDAMAKVDRERAEKRDRLIAELEAEKAAMASEVEAPAAKVTAAEARAQKAYLVLLAAQSETRAAKAELDAVVRSHESAQNAIERELHTTYAPKPDVFELRQLLWRIVGREYKTPVPMVTKRNNRSEWVEYDPDARASKQVRLDAIRATLTELEPLHTTPSADLPAAIARLFDFPTLSFAPAAWDEAEGKAIARELERLIPTVAVFA